MERTIQQVLSELRRAEKKFPGFQVDPLHAFAIVQEEAGETQRAILQAVYEPEKSTMKDVKVEAVQTAAMALRFLFNFDKYKICQSEQR